MLGEKRQNGGTVVKGVIEVSKNFFFGDRRQADSGRTARRVTAEKY
jgi:hypothetical protein